MWDAVILPFPFSRTSGNRQDTQRSQWLHDIGVDWWENVGSDIHVTVYMYYPPNYRDGARTPEGQCDPPLHKPHSQVAWVTWEPEASTCPPNSTDPIKYSCDVTDPRIEQRLHPHPTRPKGSPANVSASGPTGHPHWSSVRVGRG